MRQAAFESAFGLVVALPGFEPWCTAGFERRTLIFAAENYLSMRVLPDQGPSVYKLGVTAWL